MKNVFDKSVADELVERINILTPDTTPLWGKMSVSQMLAHCNVTYEMVYDTMHPKPGYLKRMLLRAFIKNKVTNEVPYPHSLPTAPQFIIRDSKNFEAEKQRLIDHIYQTQKLGEAHFDGKESHSFGTLTKGEWNNMFYKHLDHHLRQFGA